MALQKISLLVVLALAAIAGEASSESFDLTQYCIGLRREMSSNGQVYRDAQAALKEAHKHLNSFRMEGIIQRSMLAKAWEKVLDKHDCNQFSAEYVDTIAKCNPGPRDAMATLYAAVKEYSNECLTPDFWDEQLKKTLGNRDKTGVSQFINKQFLDQYRKDNAGERPLHFGVIGGPNCCEPERSHKALLKVLAPIVGDENAVKELVKSNRQKLENVLQKHLFKPCESYTKTMKTLMRQASNAYEYKYGGSQSFIDGLSQEFRDAIFRYRYCNNFQYLDGANAKLGEINAAKFL